MAFCDRNNGILALGVLGSGFASLGYQIVWMKQLGALFGLEALAILAAVAAYMGGLTAGALASESLLFRAFAPVRWFVLLELIAGVWGLVSFIGLPFLGEIILPSFAGTEGEWFSALGFFAAIFGAFLPATLAMGAALPVVERAWRGERCVGWIYGLNTAGAALGALTTAFFLIPELGLKTTLGLLCGLSFLIAIGILALQKSAVAGESSAGKRMEAPLPKRIFFTAFSLGFLGITYQLLCVRVLSQTLENTVYTYASILVVHLAGASLGALLYQHLTRLKQQDALFGNGLMAAAILILLSLHAMAWTPAFYDALWPKMNRSRLGLLSAELLVAGWVLLLPATAMGGLLSQLLQTGVRPRRGIGRPLSWNLLGAALAPVCFAVLLPGLGAQRFLIFTALAYAGLIPPAGLKARWFGLLGIGLAIAAAPGSERVLGLVPDVRRTILLEGPAATVSATTDASGHKSLQVNRRFQMGGTRAAAAERRQAHLPLLLHPRPERALVLGIGTGITLGAVRVHPRLQTDAVELLPEIVKTLPDFAPHNRFPYPPDQIALHRMDARRFVRCSKKSYDAIIADVFHPARDGAGLLYTVEHYRNVRARLAPGGLFCQWLPLHQLDDETLKTIIRTFNAVFPHSDAWLLRDNLAVPVLGLIGADQPFHPPLQRLEPIRQTPSLHQALQECQLNSPERLLGSRLANRAALEQYAQTGPLNTDNNQYIASRAPLIRPGISPRPAQILAKIIRAQSQAASSLAAALPPGNLRERLQTRYPSRDLYLLGLADESEGNRTAAVNKFIQSLSLHKDFTASYAKCIALAAQTAETYPAFSRWLLRHLVQLKPEEPLAQKMLNRLQSAAPIP